ncbi:hypothetical protein OU426_06980 [Frigidibacter sp. RF13]|uniref:hypothetical protein n=1 Tax=Frigidibacter sp. RF13 TaxID=2997340 RepID=UPI00227119EE|nr:hypothetical protein [Frigidibacter sp. RF13]MCY1126591.1 hypothetical protein [Frigidibacter sp. RF13]
MPALTPTLAALAALLAIFLAWRLFCATGVRARARAGYFDEVRQLFDGGESRLQPGGFPRMTGRRGERSFDLQVVPDSLTFRKLPALWVMVSLPEPLPLAATLDLMARPSGQEPFTHFTRLPQILPRPVSLPDGIAVRSDNAAAVPDEALIARHAASLFADPRVKELLISPKGLRIVFLAEEADRSRYLIFRDAEMGQEPLAAARIAPYLDRLEALRADLLDQLKEAA